MAFDYKKTYKEFYMPKRKPEIVTVPAMQYVAVEGMGDPNEEGGAYKQAIGVLYAIAYTVKMSKLGDHRMDGYFDFVVPPLEGFWWQDGIAGVDYSDKASFHWISVIRLPEFVTEEEFTWAVSEAERKKGIDCSSARLLRMDEGLCVQMMHIGSYDDEPVSVALMDAYDICVPDRFEKQIEIFKNNENLSIVGGQIKEFIGNKDNTLIVNSSISLLVCVYIINR